MGQGSAQAAPASGSGQAAAQGASSQGNAGQFIQVDTQGLKDWGGDWHKAVADAKRGQRLSTFEQRVGMSIDEYEAMLEQSLAASQQGQEQGQQQQGQQGQPAQGGDDAPLTASAIQKMLDERDAKLAQQQQQIQTQSQLNQAITEARSSQETATKTILDGVGVKPDADGKLSWFGNTVQRAVQTALDEQIRLSLPSFKQKDRNAVWNAIRTTKPTPAMIAAAQEEVANGLKNRDAEAVSSFAQGQQGTPSQTLGGGTGGKNEPKSAKDMTPLQFRNVASGLPLNHPG
jgi:hypothetical protein